MAGNTETSGIVTGEDGRKALLLALALVESGEEGRVVNIEHQ